MGKSLHIRKKATGVKYKRAEPILVLEKYGLLGRKNINLKAEQNTVPKTDSKVIYLPSVMDMFPYQRREGEGIGIDPNLTLYVGCLYHEASHIRYGSFMIDFSKILDDEFDNPNLARYILNIVEDARIEYQFKNEFINDPSKIKPLVQTGRYIVKSKPSYQGSPLKKFLQLLGDKGISGYTHGELSGNREEEEDFLKKKYKYSKGKIVFAELLNKILGIIKDIKDPDMTILDSMDKTKEVYNLISDVFADELEDYKPLEKDNNYDFDEGDINIDTSEDLDSEEKRKEFEKEYQNHREQMEVEEKDLQKELEKLKEEGKIPDDYIPPEDLDEIDVEREFKDDVKDLLKKIKKKLKFDTSKRKKSHSGSDTPKKPQSESDSYQNNEGGLTDPINSDLDPVIEFVKNKLEEKGYKSQRAQEIAEGLDLEKFEDE